MNSKRSTVGKSLKKVDGFKLVTGRPAFTDDIHLPGMLIGKILPSPHAHARIRKIDTSKAKALPGVHAVLTYKDVPRVPHTTAGQSWPEPSRTTPTCSIPRCASSAIAWPPSPPKAGPSPRRL